MRRPRWLGPYRLLYRIASGGMAEIFRGVRTPAEGPPEPVAIKCILPHFTTDPEFTEMLSDEARITGSIDHPNIARIHEFACVDESYFLVMEFVDGVDLRTLVRRARERDEGLPPVFAIWIVEQALIGLEAAHEREVVHRDFSPSNLLVSFEGLVKLIDFGIAKAAHNRSQTRVGVIKGKVKYMSPEQTLGKRLDRRSDVFAAGVVLYESLTGSSPFHAPDDPALMEAIREVDPDPPSHHGRGLPAQLDEILARALAKDVKARYPTALEFAMALRSLRQSIAPTFEASELGAFLARIFARERKDAEEQLSEFDLDAREDELTPTGQRREYTRLVALLGPDGSEADAIDLDGPTEGQFKGAVERWLAERRGPATTDEGPDAWSADLRPHWVDEPNRTQEMEPLRPETGEAGETGTSLNVDAKDTLGDARDSGTRTGHGIGDGDTLPREPLGD